mmetsp:Transcript_15643/g.36626  ORF Transcript_15643/g.36626 Transcript_15643/m.36626 type:complete len:578 (-) Transcript_15643:250-1983(-)|eukprot:CAMPEP_0178442686 /NCGR_PEP_ID=MMETSP0689_2-20121128/38347_1 /TAXON_ID=160604 /ORGANISM="Amphidinium massartii, Strain CS-259" /LENGTH=577 /DNA_ID=CAMNT_0020066349 /DNA_START=59 /DNA_END=1792 /DNA_ORIENTATION=+
MATADETTLKRNANTEVADADPRQPLSEEERAMETLQTWTKDMAEALSGQERFVFAWPRWARLPHSECGSRLAEQIQSLRRSAAAMIGERLRAGHPGTRREQRGASQGRVHLEILWRRMPTEILLAFCQGFADAAASNTSKDGQHAARLELRIHVEEWPSVGEYGYQNASNVLHSLVQLFRSGAIKKTGNSLLMSDIELPGYGEVQDATGIPGRLEFERLAWELLCAVGAHGLAVRGLCTVHTPHVLQLKGERLNCVSCSVEDACRDRPGGLVSIEVNEDDDDDSDSSGKEIQYRIASPEDMQDFLGLLHHMDSLSSEDEDAEVGLANVSIHTSCSDGGCAIQLVHLLATKLPTGTPVDLSIGMHSNTPGNPELGKLLEVCSGATWRLDLLSLHFSWYGMDDDPEPIIAALRNTTAHSVVLGIRNSFGRWGAQCIAAPISFACCVLDGVLSENLAVQRCCMYYRREREGETDSRLLYGYGGYTDAGPVHKTCEDGDLDSDDDYDVEQSEKIEAMIERNRRFRMQVAILQQAARNGSNKGLQKVLQLGWTAQVLFEMLLWIHPIDEPVVKAVKAVCGC